MTEETLAELEVLFRVRIDEVVQNSLPFKGTDAAREYIKNLEPSVICCSTNELLKLVSFDDRHFFVIRNPYNVNLFLAVERNFAHKALVLGLP